MQALPDPDLRELVAVFKFALLLEDKRRREEYLELVAGAGQTVQRFLGFPPPATLLRDAVAPIIVQRQDFLKHVRDRGGAQRLLDPLQLERLALAASGSVVAEYLGSEAHES
jgi:hypothetical protein